MQGQRISRVGIIVIALAIAFAICNSAFAQTVSWGVNGVGGSGIWDASTANWHNGTTNVPWPNNGSAVFGGATGGTVDIANPVVASSLTFNTPGYLLQGASIKAFSVGLTVTTNADATIAAPLLHTVSAGITDQLIKNGPAKLTLANNPTSIGTLRINEGEVYISDAWNFTTGTGVNLANVPGVTLTLDPSSPNISTSTLGGGGAAGGLVQPANKPGVVTLAISLGGNFGGVLADNGAGVLALDINTGRSSPPGTLTLTGANTYSGSTTVESQRLLLTGNGSATSTTAVSILPGATLELDDSGVVIGNRLSPTAPISLNAATLKVDANASLPVTENFGPLQLAGASQITSSFSPNPPQLSFAGLTRVEHGVVDIGGPNVRVAGLTNGSAGIVAPYITLGGTWGVADASGNITPYTGYVSDINTASATDNVRLTTVSSTLAAASAVGSLNLENNPVLDLGGHNLSLTNGGILSDGGIGASVISNGSLSTPAGEFVVQTYNADLTINANILDSGVGASLTKAGPRTLTLTGNNTYTGPTSIMKGTLVVSSDANLGLGTSVHIDQGTLQFNNNFATAKAVDTGVLGGTINTGGFNAHLSGAVSGNLTKIGLGTLTIDNAMIPALSAQQGLLVLPNGAPTSDLYLFGANLQAAGELKSLHWSAASPNNPVSTLDIGGTAAATLTTGRLETTGVTFNHLQINFGIGGAQSDFWSITQPVFLGFLSPGSFQFEFQNLGGLQTGVDYPLMAFTTSVGGAPTPENFILAPDLVAAGWAGAFTVTPSGLSVRFTSVPEPSGIALACLPAALFAWFVRRRASGASPTSTG